MEPWQLWLEMALDSMQAAQNLADSNFWRSSASRCYYAAFQAATALLLYSRLTPPEEREAWSHEDTPDIFRDHLHPIVPSRDKRNDLSRRLRELYKVRVQADYISKASFDAEKVGAIRKDAGYIVKFIEHLLQKR